MEGPVNWKDLRTGMTPEKRGAWVPAFLLHSVAIAYRFILRRAALVYLTVQLLPIDEDTHG